jgi:hypothetical protein
VSDDTVLRVAALKVLKDYVSARYDEAREEMKSQLNKGDRLTARSPLSDEKIGAVWLTDPERTANVADKAALLSWVEENYPEHVQQRYHVTATEDQLRTLLFQHQPEWMDRRPEVEPKFVAELLTAAADMGVPVGPGGEVDVPGIAVKVRDGVVTCRPVPDKALPLVLELHHEGVLGLDGTVRREIKGEVA